MGPSSGEKMHYNSAVGTLRITVPKKKVTSHDKQRVSSLNSTSRLTKAERRPTGSPLSPQRKPDHMGAAAMRPCANQFGQQRRAVLNPKGLRLPTLPMFGQIGQQTMIISEVFKLCLPHPTRSTPAMQK